MDMKSEKYKELLKKALEIKGTEVRCAFGLAWIDDVVLDGDKGKYFVLAEDASGKYAVDVAELEDFLVII